MVNPYLDSKPALSTVDPVWTRIRKEAEEIVAREPELATFIYSSVLHHDRLEAAVVHRIAERLDHTALSGDLIRQAYSEALRDDRAIPDDLQHREPAEALDDIFEPQNGIARHLPSLVMVM